jgi:excisionase family DNA binding protein
MQRNEKAEYALISEVARALGVSDKTVKHMERRGVLNPIRTAGGVRLFKTAEVERIIEDRVRAAAGSAGRADGLKRIGHRPNGAAVKSGVRRSRTC